MMRRTSIITAVAAMGLAVAACTANEKRTAGYGIGGAALGALAGGALSGKGRGAVAGAAIGAAAGTVVGASQSRNGTKYCNYRDAYGRMYQAPCK